MKFLDKLFAAQQEGRLIRAVKSKLVPYFYGLKYLGYSFFYKDVDIFAPNYVSPDQSEMQIVERIFLSYKAMKKDQKKVSDVYNPSPLWQRQIDESFSDIIEGAEFNDINRFHFFLSNFGSWNNYHGTAQNILFRKFRNSPIGRSYLKSVIFGLQLKFWKWFYNNNKVVDELYCPMHGNLSGFKTSSGFISVSSFSNEIYSSLLLDVISDVDTPVVAEIGGGYGSFAYYFLKKKKNLKYMDFDLPETLCLAAYYLMSSFPEKNVLLYGEDEYSSDSHLKYDMVFMPSYVIGSIGVDSVDLFLNKNSFGEMSEGSLSNYMAYVQQSSNYIFHMNHDVYRNVYSDGSHGLLGSEYPIDKDKFRLLIRYPDYGHFIGYGTIDYYMDIFFYLYQKK